MSNTELKTKIDEYREYREMLREIQDAMNAIEDDIKRFMGDSEEITVSGAKVRYTRYMASRFDTKTFKAEHAAMYEQYVTAKEARRFSIA